MIQYSNISPLPFYPEGLIDSFPVNKMVTPIITERNWLMPFQINVPPEANTVTYVHLVSADDESHSVVVVGDMIQNGLRFSEVEGKKVLRYDGNLPILSMTEEGRFYLRVRVSLRPESGPDQPLADYRSEVFVVMYDTRDCLKLVYGNSKNLAMANAVVDFSEHFKFGLFLQTSVGRPNYNFEQEAINRNGYTFIKSVMSKKTYVFTFFATEGMLDALRLIKLCDDVRITSKGREFRPITINMSPEWVNKDDLATVTIEFDTDNMVSDFGGLSLGRIPGSKPIAGDFDKDYNEDFNV